MLHAVRAMLLRRPGVPLDEAVVPDPVPAEGQALLRVLACGVCRTDLHVADGELAEAELPLVLGHEDRRRGRRERGTLLAGRPRRGAVARLDVRRVPVLSRRA